MTYLSRYLLPIVICVCMITPAVAQSESTPEVAVQQYWSAIQSGDWHKATSLIHPESLQSVRISADRFVNALVGLGGDVTLATHFGVNSKEDYQKLSDAEVFERLARSLSQQPGIKEVLQATKFRLVGMVSESENLVHILYRRDVALFDSEGRRLSTAKFEQRNEVIGVTVEVKLPDSNRVNPEVITLKGANGSWLVVTDSDIEEQVDALTKSIDEAKQSMKKVAEALAAEQAKKVRKSSAGRLRNRKSGN